MIHRASPLNISKKEKALSNAHKWCCAIRSQLSLGGFIVCSESKYLTATSDPFFILSLCIQSSQLWIPPHHTTKQRKWNKANSLDCFWRWSNRHTHNRKRINLEIIMEIIFLWTRSDDNRKKSVLLTTITGDGAEESSRIVNLEWFVVRYLKLIMFDDETLFMGQARLN